MHSNHGCWIINCTSATKSVISKCIECSTLHGKICQHKMRSLPADRFLEEPLFIYCGVDMFGPFLVKDCWKIQKRYGVTFAGLSCRAVYIEATSNLTTDSFIRALKWLISTRGNVRMIQSDNGTNSVGASIHLKKAFGKMDEKRIKKWEESG